MVYTSTVAGKLARAAPGTITTCSYETPAGSYAAAATFSALNQTVPYFLNTTYVTSTQPVTSVTLGVSTIVTPVVV